MDPPPTTSPTSTSHPPDVIHVISVFRPSSFFTPLPLYYKTKEPKLAHPLHRRVPANTRLHYRQVRPKDDRYVVTAVLHISHHRGQAKYHSNRCSQHSQSCFQAFPLSIVSSMQKWRGKVCVAHTPECILR